MARDAGVAGSEGLHAVIVYQQGNAGARRNWSAGNESFAPVWHNGWDKLRFHGSKGFIVRRKGGPVGPVMHLSDVEADLTPRIEKAPLGTIFVVRSEFDRYKRLFRKVEHPTVTTRGELVIAHAASLRGTPYLLGGCDCSWLSNVCCEAAGAKPMVHNAHAQRMDPQVIPISRAQIKPGDLLFIHDDAHVAIYLDARVSLARRIIRALVRRSASGTGRVWDTEPSDAPAPWGGYLGTGVRIRPMESGWYCDWANVNGIGRIVAINGQP